MRKFLSRSADSYRRITTRQRSSSIPDFNDVTNTSTLSRAESEGFLSSLPAYRMAAKHPSVDIMDLIRTGPFYIPHAGRNWDVLGGLFIEKGDDGYITSEHASFDLGKKVQEVQDAEDHTKYWCTLEVLSKKKWGFFWTIKKGKSFILLEESVFQETQQKF